MKFSGSQREEAEDRSVRSLGEMDDFPLGFGGEVVGLEVLWISPIESGATGREEEIGNRLLVGGKSGTEKHGAQEAFVMESADVEEKMTRRDAVRALVLSACYWARRGRKRAPTKLNP
jgi:hypothetical protein